VQVDVGIRRRLAAAESSDGEEGDLLRIFGNADRGAGVVPGSDDAFPESVGEGVRNLQGVVAGVMAYAKFPPEKREPFGKFRGEGRHQRTTVRSVFTRPPRCMLLAADQSPRISTRRTRNEKPPKPACRSF
jgi:hypothetical protein